MDDTASPKNKARKRKRELEQSHSGSSSRDQNHGSCSYAIPAASKAASALNPDQAREEAEAEESDSNDPDQPCPPHTLPVEILQEIFSYLDFGDRREARCVCRHWNSVISAWPAFIGNIKFLLRRSPSSNTYQIINSSDVQWRSLKLTRFIGTKPPTWYFPQHVTPNVTTLELQDGTFTWSWFKEAVTRFPCLENVGLMGCTREVEDDEGWSQTGDQVIAFEALRRRLKVFNITFRTLELQHISFYLKQITDPASVLTELTIVHEYQPVDINVGIDQERLSTAMADLLTHCNATIRKLRFQGTFRFVNAICTSIMILQQKKIQLNLDTFQLQEGHPIVNSNTSAVAVSPLNAEIYVKFLRDMPNLKSLSPPRFAQFEFNHDAFVEALPNDLRYFGSNIGIITPAIFNKFQKLTSLTIAHSTSTPSLFSNFVDAIGGKIYPEMRKMNIFGHPQHNLIVPIVVAFPNLVSLIIECVTENASRAVISDESLQMIIYNLSNLKVLRLKSCHGITDAGISGIALEHTIKLQNSRSVYLLEKPSWFGIRRTGKPLSHLKCLKEVSLMEDPARSISHSSITDVGIFYGLGCKDLRKLDIVCGPETSDWGLVQLGRLNPRLEHCVIYTDSKIITAGAKELLGYTLKRCKNIIL